MKRIVAKYELFKLEGNVLFLNILKPFVCGHAYSFSNVSAKKAIRSGIVIFSEEPKRLCDLSVIFSEKSRRL